MKRYVLPAVAIVALGLAPAAAAQEGRTPGTPRTEGSGRTAGTAGTPGTEGTPGTPGTGRTEGTGRTPGTGRTGGTPRELPTTGSTATALALDGAALLSAGLVLMRTRRRVSAN